MTVNGIVDKVKTEGHHNQNKSVCHSLYQHDTGCSTSLNAIHKYLPIHHLEFYFDRFSKYQLKALATRITVTLGAVQNGVFKNIHCTGKSRPTGVVQLHNVFSVIDLSPCSENNISFQVISFT
jgi:hypothetical protein